MNSFYHELVIVEGKTDISFLKSFLNVDCYAVKGFSISDEDVNFIKLANEYRGCVLLMDPDGPGYNIRAKIKKEIPNIKEIFVKKNSSIKHNKVGIAESNKDELVDLFRNNLKNKDKPFENKFRKEDLIQLGLYNLKNSEEKRELICNKLNIGHSSSKEFLLKINSISLDYNYIEEILNVK